MLRENVYDTNYGKIIVPSNDEHFIQSFNDGKYWGASGCKRNHKKI